MAQVYTVAIVDAMTYEDKATTVTWQDNDYDVVVSSEQKEALTPKEMKNLTLTVKDADGKEQKIKLNDIAKLEEKRDPEIHRPR